MIFVIPIGVAILLLAGIRRTAAWYASLLMLSFGAPVIYLFSPKDMDIDLTDFSFRLSSSGGFGADDQIVIVTCLIATICVVLWKVIKRDIANG